MKNKLSSLFLSSVAASSILLAPALHAANGTWNVDANGLWGTSANWSGGTIASNSTSTAYFTNDITADRTVSLNADYTLNSLVFGDGATGSAGSWILDNSGNSNNNLILAGTTPGITVNELGAGKTATISAIIQGTAGLVKNGSGELTLSGANTYTGTTTINAGRVNMTVAGSTMGGVQINDGTLNVTARINFGNVTLADVAGATLDYAGVTNTHSVNSLSGGGANGGNLVLGNSLFISTSQSTSYAGSISGTGALVKNGTGTQTLSGTSTYTGTTSIQNGTLSINSISSVNGGASSLGNASTVARGTIQIGATTSAGTLLYTGSGHSTDRVVNLVGTTGGATLDASGSGALVFSNAFTATGAGAKTLTLTGTNTADNRIGGAIVNNSGANTTSLTKDGTGKWVLSGANTYTGNTTINGGTLQIGSGGSTGSLSTSSALNNNGTLVFNRSNAITQGTDFASVIAGTGNVIKNGSGTLTLSGANTYTGTTTIEAGTLQIGSGGSTGTLSTSSALNNNGRLVFNRNNTITQGTDFASAIAGTGNVIQNGSGELILGGANTYTGTTTIGAGALTVSGTGQLGGGSYAGAIANSGVFNYASTADQTLSGIISGAGAVTKSGAGTLTLTGVNTYTGKTTINAGKLHVTGTGNIAATDVELLAGATLDFTGITSSRSFGSLSGVGNVITASRVYFGTASNSTYGGIISGSGQLQKQGAGTTTLSGNNTYTGYTIIGNNGALSINSITNVGGGASSLGAVTTVGGGKIFLGQTTSSGSLIYTGSGHSTDRQVDVAGTTGGATIDASGSGALVFTSAFVSTGNGIKTLTLTGNNTSTNRIGGAIVNSTGATSLKKSGTGKWVLSGANTYTGATTIDNGQLIINGTNTASAVTVTNTGTLGGSGSVGAVTVASGGTIDPGNSPGTLTVASSIWNDGGNYNWQLYNADGAAGTGYDTITSTGSLDLSGLISGGFNINLWTINSLSSTNGSAINFVDTGTYNWVLGTFGTITGFDANKININTGATNGTGGFANTFTGGTFRISTNGSGQLLLNYQGAAAADSPVWIGGSGNLSTIGTTNGSAMVFTGATGGNVTNNQLSSLASMTFSNGAGGYNFSGNAVTNGSGGIVNNSAVTQTVSLPLNLGTNQSFDAASGNLAISGNVTNNGNTLTLTGSSNTVVSGDIIGDGGLNKTGTGIATLNAAQSFTGRTTVSGGTLALGAGASLASTNINLGTLAGQGTLDVSALSDGIAIGVGQTLAGYGTVKGNTTIASGGTLAPGNSPGILNFDGNLTLNSNSTSIFEVAGLGEAGATNGFDQALVSGDLTYGGDLKISIAGSYNNATGAFGGNIFQFGVDRNSGSFNTVQYSLNGSAYTDLFYHDASNTWQIWNDAFLTQGDNGYIGINLNTGYLTVVPEPASWALFVGGVSTVLIFRRRKNS
jgi:autotransporter-associated beta strand protein